MVRITDDNITSETKHNITRRETGHTVPSGRESPPAALNDVRRAKFYGFRVACERARRCTDAAIRNVENLQSSHLWSSRRCLPFKVPAFESHINHSPRSPASECRTISAWQPTFMHSIYFLYIRYIFFPFRRDNKPLLRHSFCAEVRCRCEVSNAAGQDQ